MRMNLKVALTASAGVGLGFLAACSDSATAPNPSKFVSEVSFAAGAVTPTPAPTAVVGKLVVCKTGNQGGSFSFARSSQGNVGVDYVGNGPIDIAVNTCLEVANDLSEGAGSNITVTEGAPPANTVQTVSACKQAGVGGVADCAFANGGNLFLNAFHGYVITYNNVFTPPPPPTGCTYTKGWYRNNGSSTVIAVDGRSVADVQAIFNATPGKPGSVTFGGDNTLLNLYQQLLAALNNLGGDPLAGPDDVDDAIADALAGTGGVGTNITTTLSQTEMSDLIDVLSAFNEGTYEGWPHCDDVVVN